MYPYLLKLSKNKIRFVTLRFLLVALVISVLTGNIHLFNLLPSRIFPSQTCGSGDETSSCGMACCAGKSEASACCKPKTTKTNKLASESCHSDETTNDEVFWQLNISFFSDYYSAKERDTLTKEFLKSQAKPKISAVLGKPCPCDTQNVTTQFRFDKFLAILEGNLQTRPPTNIYSFSLSFCSILKLFTYQLHSSRAPPSII